MAEFSYHKDYKLRIVVAADLLPGQKIAQAIHAAIEFTQQHPEITANWHNISNSVVILETEDLPDFLNKHNNLTYSIFTEPDLDNKLTAIAFSPTKESRKATANLKLALRNL